MQIVFSCSNNEHYGGIVVYTHYASNTRENNLKPDNLPSLSYKVIVTITGTDFSPIEKDFTVATNPSGATIDNIPAGNDRSVSIKVLDASNNIIAKGKATGVKINSGSVNKVDILITQTGAFTRLNSRVTPRAFAISVPLSNKRYMILGGVVNLQTFCGNGCVQLKATGQTEFYDYATGLFSPGPMMTEPRVFFTANALKNGNVIITGGADAINISCTTISCTIVIPQDHIKSSIEIYDTVSNSFYKASSLNMPRAAHTANIVMQNNLLITGGISVNGITGNAELIDLNTWQEKIYSMAFNRVFHSSIVFSEEEAIIVGGSLDNNAVEFFKHSLFTLSNTITCETFFPAFSFISSSNKIIFNGGLNKFSQPIKRLTIIDPIENVILSYHDMLLSHALFSDIMLGDGNILIAGGITSSTFSTTSTSEVFNPMTRSFVRFPQLVAKRAGYASQSLSDGSALIVSGFSNINPLNENISFVETAEIYNP